MKNNTSKYFKYAIGEIVLVVIGILIALQINNWNERRKNNKELQKYLVILEKENSSNIAATKHAIKTIKKDITSTNTYLTILNTKKPEAITDATLISLIAEIGPLYFLPLNNSVYIDFINSNLASKIEVETIKEGIFKIEQRNKLYNDRIDEVLEIWLTELKPHYVKHGTIIKMMDSIQHVKLPKTYTKIDREAFINNKTLNNILMNRLIMNSRALRNFELVKNKIESLNNNIKANLKHD